MPTIVASVLLISLAAQLYIANGFFHGISSIFTGRQNQYSRERLVIIQNRANDSLTIWCSTFSSLVHAEQLKAGGNITFRFTPRFWFGRTVIWCTLMYKTFWARWDVFNDDMPYLKDSIYDRYYHYIVDDDGVHFKDNKIRNLASGKNRYVLWDSKSFKTHFLKGFVDKGVCNNLPGWIDDSASKLKVCGCVNLFEGLHCSGERTKWRSSDTCTTYELKDFSNVVSAVQGC